MNKKSFLPLFIVGLAPAVHAWRQQVHAAYPSFTISEVKKTRPSRF